MGLLDDAIREHLELKRRRGADSGEITRQEQEAFGAARRGDTEPALDAPGEFAAEAAPTALHVVEDHHHDESDPPRPHGDPADALPHAEHAEVHAHEEEHEHDQELADPPRPHGDPADALPHVEPTPVQEHRVVEPPAPPAAAPEPTPAPVEPPASVSQPTREFDLDEVRAATGEESAPLSEDDDEGEEGDVLEETPEFLQETPEHDRLWFEQRPPRDFDF